MAEPTPGILGGDGVEGGDGPLLDRGDQRLGPPGEPPVGWQNAVAPLRDPPARPRESRPRHRCAGRAESAVSRRSRCP